MNSIYHKLLDDANASGRSSLQNMFKTAAVKTVIAALFICQMLAAGSLQAQCRLLDEAFSVNPVLSATNVDGTWYPDRYPPAGFTADAGRLKLSISAADGAQLRPGAYSSSFYNTQGRKFNQCGKCVSVAKGQLYIPSDWATNHRRSDMWATAYDVSDAVAAFPIIGFRNVTGSNPNMTYWDGSTWVELGPPAAYDTWYSLEFRITGTNFEFLINNVVVGTIPADGSVYFGDVIMQAYNFNDNTLTGGTYDPGPNNSYDAYWDNLTSTGINGEVVKNMTTGLKYCSVQGAIDAAATNDVIRLETNQTEGQVTINKKITLDGNGKTLTSTSATFGVYLAVAGAGSTVKDLIIDDAGTFGVATDPGANNLVFNNVTVQNCTGTGWALACIDGASLTNVAALNNGGNGLSLTNVTNMTINGLTTSGNTFGFFSAGIGLFTTALYCPPGAITSVALSGTISIAEPVKAYSQKTVASQTISGLSGGPFVYAVQSDPLTRSYWPTKADAYTAAATGMNAPYNYSNTNVCIEELATGDYFVDDNPNGDAIPPMLIQTAMNNITSGKKLTIETGSYNERVVISKPVTLQGVNEAGCIITGTGLAGTGRGISINDPVTNVTIKNLTVQNFSGSSGNADAGIYAIGNNSNLSVEHVTIQNNVGGSGFYANGPVNGVTLNYVTSSGHTTGARGIVIWNGFKENVTITNCNVFNNNCCGIELQDGTASGVLLQNNNVHDNGDNGFGLIGLQGPGTNVIDGNILTNNGRFGMEIKNANGSGATSGAGSIVVQNNTVTRNVAIVDARDIAGIAAYRRGVLPGNVDVPTGVVIQNNTVSGYTQPSTSEGFGIVAEGTHHTISGNTVSGCDVGIQRQAGHLPYPGDGDQSNVADTYFGRGNSPVACGIEVFGNTLSNTIDTRDVPLTIASGGSVYNPASGKYFCTIQAAINDAQTINGHTLEVGPGVYAENIIVSKSVSILGPNAAINPCSGVRVAEARIVPATAAISSGEIIHVAASNVTIAGLTIDGDNTALTSGFTSTNGADIDAAEGVTVYETNISNLHVNNNIFQNLSYFGVTLYDYPAGVPSSGHIIADNKFQNFGTYDAASGIDYWGGGILLYNNQYAAVTNNCMTNVRLGIQTGNFSQANPGGMSSQMISGNTMQVRRIGVFHNLHYGPTSPYTFSGNTITGLPNANESGVIGFLLGSLSVNSTLTNNNINLSAVTTNAYGYEVWNVKNTSPAVITGGTVTGVTTGVFLNNFEGYASDATDGAHATVSGVAITPLASGTGIRVLDSPSSTHAAVDVSIGASVTITGGTTGVSIEGTNAAVTAVGDLALNTTTGNYIQLLNTAMDNQILNAASVVFDGKTGATATFTENFAIEDKIQHEIDNNTVGLVMVKANNVFVNHIVAPTANNNDYTRIKNGVEAVSNNWTINLGGTFDWTETNAAASWPLGNDNGGANTNDDYSILVPADLNGVTFTAPGGLGSAVIHGPGDVATANLEGVLYFDGAGDNQYWTISNVVFDNFDLPIGMFGGGIDDFNGTNITNNTFNLATDLNATVAPADVNQNIGIHFSYGINQTISNNTFNIAGDGVSAGANFSTSVGMQSSTSGGSAYNGLAITGNTINILNAQSANPQVVLGIWENSHGHTGNVTVSNNQFLNLSGGNNPALNLQRAFRVTSHSGPTSTVTYSGNTISGANIGFQWIAGSNFSAEMSVQLNGNTLTGNAIGVLVQSNGKAVLTNNIFDGATDNTTDLQIQTGTSVVSSAGGNQFGGDNWYVENLGTNPLDISTDIFDLSDKFRRADHIFDALDNPASGLVRFDNANLYVSTPGTGTTDETIQNAINAAALSGDLVNIESGTHTTGANASAKDVALVPGPSTACVTLNGNLLLTAGDGLNLEINGATACSQFDQLTVNGTVTLGNASLNLTLGFVPVVGNQFIIINNDGVDAVVGQFAQGSSVTVSGTTFTIQYNGGDGNDVVLAICVSVSGNIVWENNLAPVKDVVVGLLNLPGLSSAGSSTTGVSGNYSVPACTMTNFRIKPVKNIMLLNGVTAADATRIQQHVVNNPPLIGAYKRIAADVNKSNSITTYDATLVTQAIAGNPAALAIFNTSWRFVPSSYTFPNPNIPWGFPEHIDLTGVAAPVTNQNFIGVKVGDVNGSANPQLKPIPPVSWTVNDVVLKENETVSVTMQVNRFKDIAAFQMALGFDPGQLEYIGVESSGVLHLTDDNFGAFNTKDGEFRAVWSEAIGRDLHDGTGVFTVTFKALVSGVKLSEVLSLDEQSLEARAYSTDLVETGMSLEFTEEQVSGTTGIASENHLELLQNRPNPFTDQTSIGFILPAGCDAQLRIYNINGRLIMEMNKTYTAGYQQEIINLKGNTGVLYYELTTPFGTLARKMVVTD